MNFANQTITIDDQSEPGSWARAIKERPMNTIDNILEERGDRYGDFATHAEITQRLKRTTQKFLNKAGKELDFDQQEALDMILHKIGRIINGDPDYADSWVDIAGYAKLVADRLEKGHG